MRNTHYRTWSMARKMKNIENVKHTMLDLDYGEKTERGGK